MNCQLCGDTINKDEPEQWIECPLCARFACPNCTEEITTSHKVPFEASSMLITSINNVVCNECEYEGRRDHVHLQ